MNNDRFNTYYTTICYRSEPISNIIDKELRTIIKNMFVYFSEKLDKHEKRIDEVHYQVLFLTCLIITIKYEKEISFSLDTFKYFTQETLEYSNICDVISKLEIMLLSHINFDIDKFRTKIKSESN